MRSAQTRFILLAAVLALAACSTTGGGTARAPSTNQVTKAPSTVDEFFGNRFTGQEFGSFGMDRVALLPSTDSRFPAVLRVRYPADSASQFSASSSDTEHGGAQLYLALRTGPVDEAYLRFFVRFPDGFDFVKGGKLPGLYGGRANNGGKIPDGTNGFSTRFMWRANGAGEVYAYLPTSVKHGTSLGRGKWSFPTGVWAEIQQHVRLNTPGRTDGLVEVWLNGVQVFTQTGLLFRSTLSLRIDGLFFSTFFGGGNATWATPREQYAEFAGFTVDTKQPD